MEMEVAHLPGTGFGNAFAATMKHIGEEGFRDLDPFTQRHWHVEGGGLNALGNPTSYALEPGGVAVPYAAPDFSGTSAPPSPATSSGDPVPGERALRRRPLPQPGKIAAGLPEFVKERAASTEQDVVIWYTAGITHITRPEDFPVMPSETIGFRLVPRGFFIRNPAFSVADQGR